MRIVLSYDDTNERRQIESSTTVCQLLYLLGPSAPIIAFVFHCDLLLISNNALWNVPCYGPKCEFVIAVVRLDTILVIYLDISLGVSVKQQLAVTNRYVNGGEKAVSLELQFSDSVNSRLHYLLWI